MRDPEEACGLVAPEHARITKSYQDALQAMLRSQADYIKHWDEVSKSYMVPQPERRRWSNWVIWHTIGRFRRWLHRDCG